MGERQEHKDEEPLAVMGKAVIVACRKWWRQGGVTFVVLIEGGAVRTQAVREGKNQSLAEAPA